MDSLDDVYTPSAPRFHISKQPHSEILLIMVLLIIEYVGRVGVSRALAFYTQPAA